MSERTARKAAEARKLSDEAARATTDRCGRGGSRLAARAYARIGEFARTSLHRAKRHAPGYDFRNWLRVAQIDAFEKFLATATSGKVLEVSPGWNTHWKTFVGNDRYRSVDFPDFDICRDALPDRFEVVIADQVLEHCRRPLQGAQNIYRMVAPGGHALIATPFLFRVHARPHDYSRWTEGGLRQLLVDGGFADADIRTASWGNQRCARAHIGGPVREYGFGRDMRNDPEYPLMVWAIAKR
jgi:SAM-dependent methyltransferase